jgi:aminodeoxyfutalosine deaminase
MDYLAEQRIPLEVCPTSNARTRQVDSIAAHPIRRMLEHGLVVTLNSDDPPMFGATLEGEYLAVAEALDLGPAQLAQLACNAVHASFLDDARKYALVAEIDATYRAC